MGSSLLYRLPEDGFLLLLHGGGLPVQGDPLIQGKLPQIPLREHIHDLLRRNTVAAFGIGGVVRCIIDGIIPSHQLLRDLLPQKAVLHIQCDLLRDICPVPLCIEGHSVLNKKILQFQLPQNGQLTAAVHISVFLCLPKEGNIVVMDTKNAPMRRNFTFRRSAVCLTDHQIVLVKELVISTNLLFQPGIVIQIAFDLIAGELIRHRHHIADG